MKVKKVFKIIGIILLVVIVLLLIHTIRNFIIVTRLQDNIAKYADSTNYHIKSVTTEENGTIITINYYKKDDNYVIFHEKETNEGITKISIYENEERIDTFIDTKDSKTVRLNAGLIPEFNIINQVQADNIWQTFYLSLVANIRSTKINDTECYAISNLIVTNVLSNDKQIDYIERATGLSIKFETNWMIDEKEYEFNNVDDTIFIEPNINEYEII